MLLSKFPLVQIDRMTIQNKNYKVPLWDDLDPTTLQFAQSLSIGITEANVTFRVKHEGGKESLMEMSFDQFRSLAMRIQLGMDSFKDAEAKSEL